MIDIHFLNTRTRRWYFLLTDQVAHLMTQTNQILRCKNQSQVETRRKRLHCVNETISA